MFKTLESVSLFKDVDHNILHLLEPLFEPYSCTAETAFFKQGQMAHYLYLILSGSVQMLYKPYDGPPITVTTLEQGSIFGWSAVIGNAAYTSTAICQEDCQTMRMRGRNLHKLGAREPEAGRIILGLLADSVSNRWADSQNQIQKLLNTNISEKRKMESQLRKSKKVNK